MLHAAGCLNAHAGGIKTDEKKETPSARHDDDRPTASSLRSRAIYVLGGRGTLKRRISHTARVPKAWRSTSRHTKD